MKRHSARTDSGSEPRRTTALISESLRLQLVLQTFQNDRHAETVRLLPHSLRQLGSPADGRTFPTRVCDELTAVGGFDVAMFSIVEGFQLRPVGSTHVNGVSVVDDAVSIGLVAGSIEQLSFASPGDPVKSDGTISTPLISQILGTSAYLVVPVTVEDSVAAVVHVAHQAPLSPDATDIEVLGVYQRSISAVFERESWTRRAEHHHHAVQEAAAALVADSARVVTTDVGLGLTPGLSFADNGDRSAPGNPELEELLTAREAEVIRLLASGLTNAEIADRLFIGIETVKSHVKKILRKVGAVNRSEAISLYLDRG